MYAMESLVADVAGTQYSWNPKPHPDLEGAQSRCEKMQTGSHTARCTAVQQSLSVYAAPFASCSCGHEVTAVCCLINWSAGWVSNKHTWVLFVLGCVIMAKSAMPIGLHMLVCLCLERHSCHSSVMHWPVPETAHAAAPHLIHSSVTSVSRFGRCQTTTVPCDDYFGEGAAL